MTSRRRKYKTSCRRTSRKRFQFKKSRKSIQISSKSASFRKKHRKRRKSRKFRNAAVVGGVIAGVVILGAVAGGLLVYNWKKQELRVIRSGEALDASLGKLNTPSRQAARAAARSQLAIMDRPMSYQEKYLMREYEKAKQAGDTDQAAMLPEKISDLYSTPHGKGKITYF